MRQGGISLAVVAALPEEIAPLRRRLGAARALHAAALRAWSGRLGGQRVLLAVTGEGRRLAGPGLRALLDAGSPRALLLVGIGGGLSPDLAPGELVTSRAVVDLAAGERLESPPGSPPAPPGVEEGVVASAERILWRREDKAAEWQRLGRPPRALVDTETATWARVAAERGLPWRALRAVSDAAAESLPMDFNGLRDRRGAVSRWRVIRRALLRPASLPALARLARRLRAGAAAVAAAVAGDLER